MGVSPPSLARSATESHSFGDKVEACSGGLDIVIERVAAATSSTRVAEVEHSVEGGSLLDVVVGSSPRGPCDDLPTQVECQAEGDLFLNVIVSSSLRGQHKDSPAQMGAHVEEFVDGFFGLRRLHKCLRLRAQ